MAMTENKHMDGTIEKLLDSLITVIGHEAELFDEFLRLLEKQQQALIHTNLDVLNDVTSRLQTIVLHSKRLEDDRAATVEEIRRLGDKNTDLTVLQICDMADESRSTQLKTLRETVLGLYSRIEETRMRNGLLIRQSVEQIRNTIEVIGRIPAQKDMYKEQGGVSREYASLGVDRRV